MSERCHTDIQYCNSSDTIPINGDNCDKSDSVTVTEHSLTLTVELCNAKHR